MSLTIYWDKDDVLSDIEYVEDNNSFFVSHTLAKLDKSCDKYLDIVDNVKFITTKTCLDRFGISIYWLDISTGGKTLLNIFYNPDKCFSTIECGDNALDAILKLPCGNVCMQHLKKSYPSDDECDIIYDEVRYTSLKKLGMEA